MPTWLVLVVVSLSSVGYLGGLILGSGPDWSRLPGSYLAVADSRSLDPETLAAVKWSGQHLENASLNFAANPRFAELPFASRLFLANIRRIYGISPSFPGESKPNMCSMPPKTRAV